ncbi:hypothetical protein FDECE_6570 [Fusarium decemcellulare]|nr:hypothetical protein FDECE_6570 [Fusarium decemcellulare]
MKQAFALPLILAAAVESHSLGARDSDCKDVHVFLAKGNNEPYPGRQGKLAGAICSGLDSCDYEDIKFYNPLEAPYCDSVFEGAKNGIQQITDYNKKCPDSKLVVSGYSQGGHVVGDILGGGGGVFFQDCVQKPNKGLDPASRPGSKIVAAMIFGDTRHTANQPYNVLTGAGKDGLFPRPGDQLANLAKYGDVLHNYCVETDPICAQGDVVKTHLNYFDVFTHDVAQWVKKQVKAAGDDDESSSTTSSVTRKTSTTKTAGDGTSTEDATETKTATESEETTTKTDTGSKTTATSIDDTASDSEATATGESGSETTAAASSEAVSDAAAPSSTGNGAVSSSVHLGGVIMGLAAVLAI